MFGCNWTCAIWFAVLGIRGANNASQTIDQWLTEHINEPDSNRAVNNSRWSMCMITCWYIWKARCKTMYVGEILEIRALIEELGRFRCMHHRPEPKGQMRDGTCLAWDR